MGVELGRRIISKKEQSNAYCVGLFLKVPTQIADLLRAWGTQRNLVVSLDRAIGWGRWVDKAAYIKHGVCSSITDVWRITGNGWTQ